MTAANDGDASFAPVLQQGQLLGQGVHPIQRWEI
jgi:hypothetical protein